MVLMYEGMQLSGFDGQGKARQGKVRVFCLSGCFLHGGRLSN